VLCFPTVNLSETDGESMQLLIKPGVGIRYGSGGFPFADREGIQVLHNLVASLEGKGSALPIHKPLVAVLLLGQPGIGS